MVMYFSYFIRDTPVHTLTFNVIFNGTEEVLMDLIQDTISKQADHFNVENKDMMFIGQQLVYLGGGMENFPINISDYLIQNFVQTTESPGTPRPIILLLCVISSQLSFCFTCMEVSLLLMKIYHYKSNKNSLSHI